MKHLLAAALVGVCIIAQACASVTPAAPQALPATLTPVLPTEYIPTAIPITPTYEGCAYVWGSEELPELSRRLNAELQKISTDLTALAYAFGEDCVYGNGHKTFSAMETDFRVGVKVKTVKDEGALGDWIAKVMPIVLDLPPEQLEGPRTGRVDFSFEQPDPAQLFVTVPIDKYRREAGSLRGAELLHLFYTP
jgi:hypothetical protein